MIICFTSPLLHRCTTMNRYLLNIAYIGTKFRGIQKTVNKKEEPRLDTSTIQGSIEIGLQALKPKNPIVVHLSSRTDAGVHALNSTVHVDLERHNGQPFEDFKITYLLNNLFSKNDLPIRILKTTHVPETFHCRYNAKGRSYLYRIAVAKKPIDNRFTSRIQKNFATFIPIEELERCYFLQEPNFDIEAVRNASKLFLGKHDFRTFMSTTRSRQEKPASFCIRSISNIEILPGKPLTVANTEETADLYDFYDFHIHGRSFLYKQVRRIIGTLLAVGCGKITQRDVYQMITIPSKHSWCSGLAVMPPFALYLCKVHYDENDFKFPNSIDTESTDSNHNPESVTIQA